MPVIGRLPAESQTELLLSERFWQTGFGADPDVIDSTISAAAQPLRIVGVARLPSGFPGDVDVVDVIDFGDGEDRAFRAHEVIARIRPGHSVAEAKAEANAFITALAETHPEHRGCGIAVVVFADDLIRPFRGVLALLLAAGTTFLLIACVNVMGLVAARRVYGRHDRSIRLALGASEGRLLRGSLVESILLAFLGSVAGGLSAYWLIGSVRALCRSRFRGSRTLPSLCRSGSLHSPSASAWAQSSASPDTSSPDASNLRWAVRLCGGPLAPAGGERWWSARWP